MVFCLGSEWPAHSPRGSVASVFRDQLDAWAWHGVGYLTEKPVALQASFGGQLLLKKKKRSTSRQSLCEGGLAVPARWRRYLPFLSRPVAWRGKRALGGAWSL